MQRDIVFYDPPCYKLKWKHVVPSPNADDYTEIIEFTHPKFFHSRQWEIRGTEKDNPERLEGHPQFY